MKKYDYIVVGAGTAGFPLAVTPSQNFTVLLLERGGLGHTLTTIVQQDSFLINLINTDNDALRILHQNNKTEVK